MMDSNKRPYATRYLRNVHSPIDQHPGQQSGDHSGWRTYTDLGAIVHDNQGHDLSYRTFINGALSGNILIDTSQAATDTIDYVATDNWGNTSTSTRTVIIEASPSIIPTNEASTTASTTP